MTDITDAAIGAATGLLAVGIVANVAGHIIGKKRKPTRRTLKSKRRVVKW